MKKFILPSIFAFGLLFSCNNDDDSSIESESIVGTWTYTGNQIQYSKDNKIVDEKLDLCQEKNTLIFLSDNKFTFTSYEPDNNGKCIVEDTSNGSYSITNNKIKIIYAPDDISNAEIVKITKNELVLKADYGKDLDNDGKNEVDLVIYKR